MEAPRIYCSLTATSSAREEHAVSTKEPVKLKSFLPKVLFRNNIDLQTNLARQCRHISTEEKRSLGFLNHTQKVFIHRRKTQRQSQVTSQTDLFHYLTPQSVTTSSTARTFLLRSSEKVQHKVADHHSHGDQRNVHVCNKSKGKRRPYRLRPIRDPRSLNLEQAQILSTRKEDWTLHLIKWAAVYKRWFSSAWVVALNRI